MAGASLVCANLPPVTLHCVLRRCIQPGDGIIITKSAPRKSASSSSAKGESFAAVITTVTQFDTVDKMLTHTSLDSLLPGIVDDHQAVGLLELMYPALGAARKDDRGRALPMMVFGLDVSPDARASVVGRGRTATPDGGRRSFHGTASPGAAGR